MATKHIAFLASGSGFGSWGTGATAAEAMKNAKKEWPGGKVRETKTTTHEVPDGMKLMIRETVTGIEWWTEPIDPAPAPRPSPRPAYPDPMITVFKRGHWPPLRGDPAMPATKTPAEIVAAASAAYPDDYIAECYDAASNSVVPENMGDSLAVYILAEILSACDDADSNRDGGSEADDTDPVVIAICYLEEAAGNLRDVIAALRAIEPIPDVSPGMPPG